MRTLNNSIMRTVPAFNSFQWNQIAYWTKKQIHFNYLKSVRRCVECVFDLNYPDYLIRNTLEYIYKKKIHCKNRCHSIQREKYFLCYRLMSIIRSLLYYPIELSRKKMEMGVVSCHHWEPLHQCICIAIAISIQPNQV